MPRHRRDSTYHLKPRKYPLTLVYPAPRDSYLDLEEAVSSQNVTTSSDLFFNQEVSVFSNGEASFGTYPKFTDFTFSTWLYLELNQPSTILEGTGSFSVVIDPSTDALIFTRVIYGVEVEEFSIPFQVNAQEWVHLIIIRAANVLKVVKNLVISEEITNYYYPIPESTIYIGKSFTGRLYNSILAFSYDTSLLISNDVDILKQPFTKASIENENAEAKLIDLRNVDIVSSSNIFPLTRFNTFYDPVGACWVISRTAANSSYKTTTTGLLVIPPSYVKLTLPYTIEIAFELDDSASEPSNLIIASQWYSGNNRSWYLWYEFSSNNLYFAYLNKSTNTVIQHVIGTYADNIINYVTIINKSDCFNVYLNGAQVYTQPVSLVKLHRFQFNQDNLLVADTGNSYKLHRFIVSPIEKYTSSYLPFLSRPFYKYTPSKTGIYSYHYDDEVYLNKRRIKSILNLEGPDTVAPGTSQEYTISFINRRLYPTTVFIKVDIGSLSDLVPTDITVPASVSVSAGAVTASFTLQISNYSPNKYKNKFTLTVYTSTGYFSRPINIVDSRPLPVSTFTSLSGYIEGFLSSFSTVQGSIPNIAGTVTATTSGDKVDTLYGTAYTIRNTSEAINFTAINNIRTAILVYKELSPEYKRGYFGHVNLDTFNGGINQELIGSLTLDPDEYIKAIDIQKKASIVKLAEADNIFVAVDESTYNVLVYERLAGLWTTEPVELELDLADNMVIINSSLDINSSGTVIALGFQNANTGEGVVQVWVKQGAGWYKDLHLGSPTPAPYTGGFGHSVAINDDGTRLFVSQIGSSTVYIFEKDTLWDASPVETFLGSNRFGHVVSCDSTGDVFYVNEVDTDTSYIYSFNSTWSLSQTIPFGTNGTISKNGNFLLISKDMDGVVSLYNKPGLEFAEAEILIGSPSFGYSLSVNNEGDLAIGSPYEHKVYYYKAATAYNTFSTYVSDSVSITDFYGYSCSVSINSLLISDFYNDIELYTTDSSSVVDAILAVRQDYTVSEKSDILKTYEPQILTFYTSLPMSIDAVGKTRTNSTLNGLVYGWLFFNKILSSSEIENLEDILKRYLALNSRSLYDI